MITITGTDALLRIDLLKTFGLPTGGLYVPDGEAVVGGVNALSFRFRTAMGKIVDVQDWHPKNHSSFASNNPGTVPLQVIDTPTGKQVMWPDHAIEGTDDAAFLETLETDAADVIIRKGRNPAVDSYSAFRDNAADAVTGLAGLLHGLGIKRVFVVGLAYDFCVGWSALDAIKEGFETYVVKDLCRAINAPTEEGSTTVRDIEAQFAEAGVHVINLDDTDWKNWRGLSADEFAAG